MKISDCPPTPAKLHHFFNPFPNIMTFLRNQEKHRAHSTQTQEMKRASLLKFLQVPLGMALKAWIMLAIQQLQFLF